MLSEFYMLSPERTTESCKLVRDSYWSFILTLWVVFLLSPPGFLLIPVFTYCEKISMLARRKVALSPLTSQTTFGHGG